MDAPAREEAEGALEDDRSPVVQPARDEAEPAAPAEQVRPAAAPASIWRPALTLSEEAGLRTGLPANAGSNIALVQPSLAWRLRDVARATASLSGIVLTQDARTTARLRVREAYGGATAGDFDFALGKKMLRWSNGYAFTPAGVLDPPRRPSDPTDRLNLNEGRGLALGSFVHGPHAFTAAWASAGIVERSRPGLREVTALRYNTLVRGVDGSLIAAWRRGLGAFVAATFTAVPGSNLELHGDIALGFGAESLAPAGTGLVLRSSDRRRVAALLGGKLTLPGQVSAIVELQTSDGLLPLGGIPAAVDVDGSSIRTQRRQQLFVHLGKSRLRERPGWRDWDVGAVLLAGISDGGKLLVLDVERRLGTRLAIHGRWSVPAGPKQRSEYGMIPWTSEATVCLRLQM